MYRAKYPDIAKLKDEVRKHFPGATLFKVSKLKSSSARSYLDCPYSERDLCKKLGARWDKAKRKWYVPEGVDKNKFEKWLVNDNVKGDEIKLTIDDLLKKKRKHKRR